MKAGLEYYINATYMDGFDKPINLSTQDIKNIDKVLIELTDKLIKEFKNVRYITLNDNNLKESVRESIIKVHKVTNNQCVYMAIVDTVSDLLYDTYNEYVDTLKLAESTEHYYAVIGNADMEESFHNKVVVAQMDCDCYDDFCDEVTEEVSNLLIDLR